MLVDGIELPDGVTVTAELGRGAVVGSSGCNSYRATYEAAGDELRIGPIAATLMMCPEPAMAVEAEVHRRLGLVARFRLVDERLELLDLHGQLLLGLGRLGPADLLGTWQVLSIHWPERQAIVSVDGEPQLTFEPTSVHGHAGCNRFHGPWSAVGRELRLGPLATTRMLCPEPVMAQEHALLRALESATAWRLGARHVDLLRADGGIAVSLRRLRAADEEDRE